MISRGDKSPLVKQRNAVMRQTHMNDLALLYSQDRVKHARSYLRSIFDWQRNRESES
jgi:hypothetical protein